MVPWGFGYLAMFMFLNDCNLSRANLPQEASAIPFHLTLDTRATGRTYPDVTFKILYIIHAETYYMEVSNSKLREYHILVAIVES